MFMSKVGNPCATLGQLLASRICTPRQLPILSNPVRSTPPYRAIPFRDSIAEGVIARILPCFERVSHKYR